MLDAYLFETIRDLEFRQHSPRDAEKILDLDAPWEGRKYHGFTVCGYPVVLKDGDRFRLYYASYLGLRFEPRDPETQFTCYAESDDGVTWNRVRLGRVEFEGTAENNILLKGRTSHNFAPFIDNRPGTPESERYKAVGGNPEAFVFASADGLEWRKLKDEPILDGEEPAFDRYGAIRWGRIRAAGGRSWTLSTSVSGIRETGSMSFSSGPICLAFPGTASAGFPRPDR